jgi:flagellar hook-length control protein FliK
MAATQPANPTQADAPPAPGSNAHGPTPNSPLMAAEAAIKAADSSGKVAADDTGKSAPQISDVAAAPQPPQQTLPPLPIPAANMPNLAAVTAAAASVQTASNVSDSVHVAAQAPNLTPDVNSLAVEIAARSQSGAKQFDIRLDPPELGRVDVRLSIDASGKAQAHMTADQPETLNLLQRDSTTLTQALRDAGLDVSQNGLNFSLRGQSGQQGQDGGAGRAPRGTLTASRVIDSVQAPSAISFSGGAGNARLDIHV